MTAVSHKARVNQNHWPAQLTKCGHRIDRFADQHPVWRITRAKNKDGSRGAAILVMWPKRPRA